MREAGREGERETLILAKFSTSPGSTQAVDLFPNIFAFFAMNATMENLAFFT